MADETLPKVPRPEWKAKAAKLGAGGTVTVGLFLAGLQWVHSDVSKKVDDVKVDERVKDEAITQELRRINDRLDRVLERLSRFRRVDHGRTGREE